ncbi:MAG: PQQ-binding-like beta-propeller repeat protein, partial [Gemmataceae bacterium]
MPRRIGARGWTCSAVLTMIACVLTAAHGEDWSAFRGSGGQGISSEKGLPTRWTSTENIAWKTAIPGESWSSPIVRKGRVFVTSALDAGASFRLICLDRADGKILWNREVHRQKPSRKETRNSYATSTPAADDKRVYVVCADGAIIAVNYEGRVEWTNREVHFYGQHGLGTSPLLYHD